MRAAVSIERGWGRTEVLVPGIALGIVIGVLEVVLATSFMALVFAGPMAPHLPAAIGVGLAAAAVVLTVVAVGSSLPGAVGSLQDSPAAILVAASASVAAALPALGERAFLTLLLVVGLSSVASGAFFLLLGAFRLGNLIRFVPYPVIGGFMAGTGWLIFKGGASVLTGVSLSLSGVSTYLGGDLAAKWVPGLAFGAALLLASRRWAHYLLIPGALAAAVVVFYAAVPLAGSSIAEVEANGWLLGPFEDAALWRLWTVSAATGADWGVVFGQAGTIATVLVVSVIALLLNASGIELAAGRDVDLNRELRVAGGANLLAGALGGLAGFHALSLTVLAQRAGARTRAVGVAAGGVLVSAVLFGGNVIALFPRPVLGGLLVFLGLAFLYEWVVEAWSRLPRAEYAIAILILVVIAAFGFVEGVALGLALALVVFVVTYSRTSVVKHSVSGDSFHSNVDRAPRMREILRERGAEIHVLELQGFIFFGTANALLARARDLVADPDRSFRFLVLDFRRVTGLDSSAGTGFLKMRRLAEAAGATLVLTGVRHDALTHLESAGVLADPGRVRLEEDLDRGLQWCEERLLESAGAVERDGAVSELALLGDEATATEGERLTPYLELMEIGAGETIILQGAPSDDLFLLVSGRLTVEVAGGEGVVSRLRSVGPGAIVGEITMYLGSVRTASVVAEEPCELLRLSRESLERMESEAPDLAARVHRRIAGLLAERLSDTTRTVRKLLD